LKYASGKCENNHWRNGFLCGGSIPVTLIPHLKNAIKKTATKFGRYFIEIKHVIREFIASSYFSYLRAAIYVDAIYV
jgi:hypothetical protein